MKYDGPITSKEPSGRIRTCGRRRTCVVAHELQNQVFHNVYINQSFAVVVGLVGYVVRSTTAGVGVGFFGSPWDSGDLVNSKCLPLAELQAQTRVPRLSHCSSTCSAASRQVQQAYQKVSASSPSGTYHSGEFRRRPCGKLEGHTSVSSSQALQGAGIPSK
ncbi:hypothetical protein HYPSUDRAFT_457072 [Hypholoma sublateritium FD-334 SS-4]|uniref:Uncharacterized protein n=1 Tax=Hypholoma sublateritium (strain FD-334 SS-4) TaxID=945553 RepID=A0A0D2LCG1_HYPSF|nr:hypothetical protein HYPSUDRAFT_457072 [Hypholoma sublateritium FD-334 SS-4]